MVSRFTVSGEDRFSHGSELLLQLPDMKNMHTGMARAANFSINDLICVKCILLTFHYKVKVVHSSG